MNKGSVYTKIENHIATVEFFHPASNSLPKILLERLASTFTELGKNKDVYVIVLKSEKERAFCAGAFFNELTEISNIEEGTAFFLGFANVINAMKNCPQPIIGRIQGKVVGGGVGLVAACDYCFATENASIKLSELSIGIGPFVIEPVVKFKIGTSAFNALVFNAEKWQNAYWAKEKGLYMHVFETSKEMDEELGFFVSKMAKYNPESLYAVKKINWEVTAHWNQLLKERATITGKLVLSEFTKEKLSKFTKK